MLGHGTGRHKGRHLACLATESTESTGCLGEGNSHGKHGIHGNPPNPWTDVPPPIPICFESVPNPIGGAGKQNSGKGWRGSVFPWLYGPLP